jgi:hypothetical protein
MRRYALALMANVGFMFGVGVVYFFASGSAFSDDPTVIRAASAS